MTEARELLSKQVWRAFFGKHGGKLRPIQTMVLEQMDRQSDALVIAGTGSGKTEAVFAPVADLLLQEAVGATGPRCVVVSPTRALASDLHRRMSPVFQAIGLRMDVATSDARTKGSSPSDVLIRTPEGLDSSLARTPESYFTVLTVILDELHMYVDNPRGTQLLGVLARLPGSARHAQRIGISATVPNLEAPAAVGLLRDPVIIEGPTEIGREILLFFRWLGSFEQAAVSFLRFLKSNGCRKAIGFAKTKNDVEKLAKALNQMQFSDRCFAHHANLSSALRREVEARFRALPSGIIIATSTLEVGIDIGSIDTCILFDPPPDHESYRQRIGRAGRRSAERRVVCVERGKATRIDYQRVAVRPSGRRGSYPPFLSGVLQQILSTTYADHGVSLEYLFAFCLDAYKLPMQAVAALVEELVRREFLQEANGRITPGPKTLELADSRRLHLTFAPNAGASLVDVTSGEYLGVAPIQQDSPTVLGGKARRLVRVDPASGAALVANTDAGEPSFLPAPASVFDYLAQQLAALARPHCRLYQ